MGASTSSPRARALLAAQQPRFRSWPITEVRSLEKELQAMGLRLPADDIDGTGSGAPGAAPGAFLSDALVSVGPAGRGGTGSFISSSGLIITNHHVALDAVRQASSTGSDYLQDGFVARCKEEEILGPDYEVWITRACRDVSGEFADIRGEPDPLRRTNLVRDRRQELARAAEAERAADARPGALRCEVQEMWPDRTYVLFTYERLRDVRIVYVPPMALGNFGGDTDNFEWPRHTADFTLLRAYVGPDGSAAEHSVKNVPYRPNRFLEVSAKGASPGDFVFLLGFPGSTRRYAPSSQLGYNTEVAVPALLRDFGAKLALIREHTTDRSVALKLASARKSLANEHKRSLGKQVMMRKLGLLEERRAEEARLCAAAPTAAAALERLAAIYAELRRRAPRSEALDALQGVYHGSTLLAVGHAMHEAGLETAKPDGERESMYRERNVPFMIRRLTKRLNDLHPPHEAALVRRAARIAAEAGLDAEGLALGELETVAKVLDAWRSSPVAAPTADKLKAVLGGAAAPPDDAVVRAAASVYASYVADRDATKALFSERDRLLATLLEAQRSSASAEERFYPDANGCLRLSAGHVEGYAAADAVHHAPVTTLAGLVAKHEESDHSGGESGAWGGDSEFACPQRLLEACATDPAVSATPVCICYSTDTVGGNSGSPVLDADGNFVAINFDRQRLGLINEFKWSQEYSRSIGTDVRYILWLVGEYDKATWLVNEMMQRE